MRTKRGGAANVLIGLATALAIVAVTLPLFLNPVWVAFEQGRAGAADWTGFSDPDLRAATNAILADLIVGPPDFDVAVSGTPVLNERERGHMRDVRGVFVGFFAVAAVLASLALFVAIRRRGAERTQSWVAVLGGALGLISVLILGGIVSFVAFDALFETFHQIFFAGGSYTFDPATERLVQLFPFQFWQETAIVVGAVCIVLAGVVVAIATVRVSAADARAAAQAPPEVADGTATSMSATGSSR
ncbi:MAG: family rane protein [Chloroflexota bacterium]|nr:family rane protein [Chloroflexota bacterium]